jgi:hypothetical protein
VTDTSPGVERLYREMLLERPGAERLRMACSMLATARALALASLQAQDPLASPSTLRRRLFLRLYGGDFGADEQARITARLDLENDDVRPAAAPPRRVPVNWDDLETALTMNPGEWTCYLDLRTGEVQMVPLDGRDDGDWPSEDELDDALEAGHLIHIEPLESGVEHGWMTEFASSLRAGRLRDRLEAALGGHGAFRRFKDALRASPAERERWFAFRDERLRAAAREWLAAENIEPTTRPRG